MKNINVMESLEKLEAITIEGDKKEAINMIASFYKDIGYNAISEEIRNNRKAKDNALYGLNMYYNDLVGDRINVKTNEVYEVSEHKKEVAGQLKQLMEKMINTFLDNGTDKQREYLKLKLDYDNANYLYIEKMTLFLNDDMEEQTETERNNFSLELDELEKQKKEAENKLDHFVMSHL